MARKTLTPVRVDLVQIGSPAIDRSSVVLLCIPTAFEEKEAPTIGAFMKCTLGDKAFQFKIPESARPKGYIQSVKLNDVRAAVVAYNVAESTSFDNVKTLVEGVQRAYPKTFIALLGSTIDLVLQGSGSSKSRSSDAKVRQVSKEKAQAYAKDAGLPFYETSAKTGNAVVDAFKQFASKILLEHVLSSARGTTSGKSRALNCGATAGSDDCRVKLSKVEEISRSETRDTEEWESGGHFESVSSYGPLEDSDDVSEARPRTPNITLQNNETVGQAEPISEIDFSPDSTERGTSPVIEGSQAHSEAGAGFNIELEEPVFDIKDTVENLGVQCDSTNSINDRPFTVLDLKKPPPEFEVSLVRRPLNADDFAALQGPEPTPASEIIAMIPFEYAENALAYCLKTVSDLLATLPSPKPEELERRRAALAAINNIALNLRDERVPRE